MRRLIKFVIISLFSIAVLIFGGIFPSYAAELQMFSNSRLINNPELQELQDHVKKAKSPQGLLDLNTATEKELRSIKGIGPVLAERIIAGRPYRTIDDLLKVKGIGLKKLKKMRLYFVVGKK